MHPNLQKKTESSLYLSIRLFKEYIVPYWNKLVLALIFMIIVAAANATHAWMIKPALDEIFFNHDKFMLIIIPLIIIVVALIKSICSYFQNYFIKYISQKVVIDFQEKLYQHLIRSDIEFLASISSGKLLSKFSNDILVLKTSLTNFLTSIAKELFTLVFLIGVMITLSITLSFITFIVFPIAIYPVIKMGRKMRRIADVTQEELGNYTATLDGTFKNIKIIKSFLREDFEIKKARNILERIFTSYVKAIRTESFASPIMEILSGIAIAAVIWYGGLQVINGSTSPGSFFAFITAFIAAYRPIKSLADLNNNIQEGLAAAKRLFVILDANSIVTDSKEATKLKISNAAIKIYNVKFCYSQNKMVLDGISFTIAPGSTVALVGSSGSGKSTILNLILRFYDTTEGEILIDNQNIRDVTLNSLRSNISYVSQDVMLNEDTITANIEYGNLGANIKNIKNAASIADADIFINKLPDKYLTNVGQYGSKISGGQKQRISIARALLKDAPILIFDEATSSLDSISERKIFENLKKIRKNKTNIIVTHRLSTIVDVDKIFVFKDGKVIEEGNHIELIQANGEYKKLYEASLSNDT